MVIDLKINMGRTFFILLSKKKWNAEDDWELFWEDDWSLALSFRIKDTDKHKFLGVIGDKSSSWKEHTVRFCKKILASVSF